MAEKKEVGSNTYTKEDKLKIKKLKEAGKELDGTESSDLLDTMIAELEADEAETTGEAEEKEGVPNSLPIRHEEISKEGKTFKFGVFFVAEVKGGFRMYDYNGRAVSPVYNADSILPGSENSSSPTKALSQLNKQCALFNAERRRKIRPSDSDAIAVRKSA